MTSSFEEKIAKLKTALENVFLKKTDVKDNLTSSDIDKPLSAKQGKWLKDNAIQTAGTNLSKSGVTLNHATSGVGAKSSGLYKTTIDAQGHITTATAVAKTDITGLGISASDHTHSSGDITGLTASKNVVTSSDGKLTTEDKYTHPSGTAKTGNPTANQTPAFGSTFTVTQFTSNAQGHISGATDRTVKIPNALGNGTTAGLSTNDYTTTEKTKLGNIAENANNYSHPNSGVTAGTNQSSNQTPAFNATFNIPKLTYDAQGHITASANSTVKIPALPTANTSTAGILKIGTTANDACAGNDSRLSDSRVPIFTKITASSTSIVDLNTYRTGGFYYNDSNTEAQYIIHCPNSNGTATPYTGNKAFFLLVETWGVSNNTYVKQTLTYYNDNNTYVRTKSSSTDAGTGWSSWKRFDTNSNTYDRNVYAANITAGEALAAGNLAYGKSDGKYYKIATNGTLDINYPILYINEAITSGTAGKYNNYNILSDVNIQSTISGKTVTTNKRVYLEGTLSGKTFTISDNVFVSEDAINSTKDGKYYIPLGTSSATNKIRFNSFEGKIVYKYTTTNGLLPVGYSYNDLLDKPSTMTPSSHTHSSSDVTGLTASKNVVTDANGKITTEAKPTIPSASSTTPSADISGGAIGSGTTWAKADHQHPLSTAYATSGHNHSGTYVDTVSDTLSSAGTVLGKIKANTTVKGTISHPKPLSSAVSSGLYKIAANTDGHITSTTAVAKADITGLGISASDHTHNYLPTNANGTTTGTLTATKFINSSSNNTNILLGNGNTLAQSTFATASHTHSASDLPSTMTPSSHTHGNLQNDGAVGTTNNASKNVVTDSSGKITTEDKPIIPKVFYGTCSTAANQQIKEVSTSSDYDLQTGTILFVKFQYGQTYNASASNPVKLKINSATTNIDITYVGTTKTTRYFWNAGEVVTFIYDGTNFIINKGGLATTTYYGLIKLSSSTTSTSESLAATAKAVKTAYDLADGKADASHNHGASEVLDSAANTYANLGTLTADTDQQTINYTIDNVLGNKSDSDHTHNYAASNHNHSGTYVDGAGSKNSTNGSAIAEIKANTTVKGTIYHPKIHTGTVPSGVPTANTTIGSNSQFTVTQPTINADGHVTALTTRTYTLPTGSTSQKGILQIGTGSGNAAAGNHTHTVSNITDFPSIPNINYELKETVTGSGVTVKVYANDFTVYLKFSGTASLTANTNLTVGTMVNTDYAPKDDYEYGWLFHSYVGMYGAVNESGVIYVINKTTLTSAKVMGSITYPLKSTLP